jgi:hypothetical protein
MRDLDLWNGDASPAAVRTLATWSLPRRVPYLGRLLALVEHADAELRAAALEALAGCRGVTGVRAMVKALDDPDATVRAAALGALRITGRDAPGRMAHAVFHPSELVRRASLVDMPHAAAHLAVYLRADPACAELAATAPWPRSPLPLAFDLHAAGTIAARELVELITRQSTTELSQLFATEVSRPVEVVSAYLESIARAPALAAAPGRDVIDQLARAIHEVAGLDPALAARGLDALVATLGRRPVLARRTIASLLSCVRSELAVSDRMVLGAAIALEPRLLESTAVRALGEPDVADAAVAALFHHQWPTRPDRAHVKRLTELSYVHGDLALAVAVVALEGGARLRRLKKLFGESDIVNRLVGSDRGWDEMCALPPETPALELAWLARVAKISIERYVVLATRALGVFRDKRLDAFVDQIPRVHRAAVFLRFARGHTGDPARVGAAARAIANRLDRQGVAEVLGELLGGAASDIAIARTLSRELTDKALASAVGLIADDALVTLTAAIDGPDALPRDREVALAAAVAARPHPALQDWARRMLVEAPQAPPPVRAAVARAIDETVRHRIASCPDSELERALAPRCTASPRAPRCSRAAIRRRRSRASSIGSPTSPRGSRSASTARSSTRGTTSPTCRRSRMRVCSGGRPTPTRSPAGSTRRAARSRP